MRGSSFISIASLLGVALAAMLASAYLSGSVEASRPAAPTDIIDRDLDVRASHLRGFTFGADGLVADLYYMRALQYVGDKIIASGNKNLDLGDLRSLNARLLYPLLDAATDVDPQFKAAYNYGAVVLPAIDAGDAVKLLEKGIAANPENWRLYQHLGYIHWRSKDYDKAAQAYSAGSQIAGASVFMKMMAASMNREGGSRATARSIFSEMVATTDDPNIRASAERRLMELDALDQIDAIDLALAAEKERTGVCPADLGSIIERPDRYASLRNTKLLVDRNNRIVDPSGVPYVFDRTECKLEIDRVNSKLPIGD